MTSYPKGNLLPDHVRNAIRAYLRKASRERPVVISSAVRDIQARNHLGMSDEDLTKSIADEAIKAGLNIHFDGPIE
jgi:hypothetical protein